MRGTWLARVLWVTLSCLAGACGGADRAGDPSGRGGSGAQPRTPTALPPPTAPLAAGTWVARTPCPMPLAMPDWVFAAPKLLLTFDDKGRLFGLVTAQNDETLPTLWQWDDANRHFAELTPCSPPASWPKFRADTFDYDPVKKSLLTVGTLQGNPLAFDKPIDGGDWVSQTGLPYWAVQTNWGAKLVRDERRHSVVIAAPSPIERSDSSGEWTPLYKPGSAPAQGGGPPNTGLPVTAAPFGYDPVRGKFVDAYGDKSLETWEQDPTTLAATQRTGSSDAIAATSPQLWWDPVAARVCMITLAADGSGTSQVWGWESDAGRWTKLDASGTAPARISTLTSLAVDPSTGDVAFWMSTEKGDMGGYELWRWGARTQTWTRLSPDRWPTLWPQALSSAAYDEGRDRLVVVTAPDGGRIQIIEWDRVSGTFTDRTSDDASPWPTDMTELDVAYDPDQKRLIMFGQSPSNGQELWEWDGATGTWRQRKPPPSATPSDYPLWPSYAPATVTYDWARGRFALWDGAFFPAPALLEWDSASSTWQPEPMPIETMQAFGGSGKTMLVADQRRGRLVVIARGRGMDASSLGPRIVEWDGTNWTVPTVPAHPEVGDPVLATYDARAGKTIILSVTSTNVRVDEITSRTTYQSHLLSWDGAQLVDVTPASLASVQFAPTTNGALVYDGGRGNLLLLGGAWSDANFDEQPRGTYVWEGSPEPAP